MLVEQVGEFGALALVAGGRHVAMLLEMTLDVEILGGHSVAAVCSACMSGAPQTPSGRAPGEFVDRCVAMVVCV